MYVYMERVINKYKYKYSTSGCSAYEGFILWRRCPLDCLTQNLPVWSPFALDMSLSWLQNLDFLYTYVHVVHVYLYTHRERVRENDPLQTKLNRTI